MRRFLNLFFCSNIASSKTSFWARPLKTDHSKLNACNVCSLEAHLEVLSGCVPEETHVDADYDWKTSQSSKGKTDVYALPFRLSLWVSDLVHEVSVRQQRLRGKE